MGTRRQRVHLHLQPERDRGRPLRSRPPSPREAIKQARCTRSYRGPLGTVDTRHATVYHLYGREHASGSLWRILYRSMAVYKYEKGVHAICDGRSICASLRNNDILLLDDLCEVRQAVFSP